MKVVGLISMLILLAVPLGAVRTSAPRDAEMGLLGFGRPPERQIREPDSQPMWSPDGRTILFRRESAVLAVGLDGGRPRTVAKQGSVTWLPSGKLGVSSYPSVSTMNPDGSRKRLITTGELPTWSPDGTKVVVSRYSPQHDTTKLFVVDVRSGAERPVARPRCRCSWTDGQPAVWSPDSERLFFARFIDATDGQRFELDLVDSNGTNLRPLAKEELEGVSLSPQGDRVAGTTWDESGRVLWVISAEDGSRARIGRGATPSWSPSGDLLAYRGADGVYVSRPDGTGVRRLAGPTSLSSCGTPQWSRDGRSILWRSGSAIVVSSVDGAGGRTVAEGEGAVWSPENDRIAFATPRCGADQGVYTVRPDGTDVLRLTRHCTIYGTRRPERTVGTPADDGIFARDRKRDRIECLEGSDRVIGDKVDVVVDCEIVRRR